MHSACTRTCSRPTLVFSYCELHAAPAYAVSASPTPQRSCRSRRAADGPRFFSVLTFNSTAFGVAKRRLKYRAEMLPAGLCAVCRWQITHKNWIRLRCRIAVFLPCISVLLCRVLQLCFFATKNLQLLTIYNNFYIAIYYVEGCMPLAKSLSLTW